MTLRRSGRRVAVVSAVFAIAVLTSCKPLLHPAVPTTPAPAGESLAVSAAQVARLGTFEVEATGCAEDFQFVEVRLVSVAGSEPVSVAVTTGSGGEPIEVAVPAWTPSGKASVQASCLEPNLSGASDGADIQVFTYPAVSVTVAPYPARETAYWEVPAVVADGVLRVSGTDCGGRVLVSVARGPWKVASTAEFHYGRTLVTADGDGNWAAEIPLRYSGSFDDPAAPGTMTAFAVCEGEWLPAATFEVVGTAPAIHRVGADPSLMHLSQCPEENRIAVLGLVGLAGGGSVVVSHEQPASGYGEQFVHVPLPAGAEAVIWFAACGGAYDPSFTYAPQHWAV